MATIICPHCQHRMQSRSLKPGTFKPKCSKCQTVFVLKIPDGFDENEIFSGLAMEQPAAKSPTPPLSKIDATRIDEPPNVRPSIKHDETRADAVDSPNTRAEVTSASPPPSGSQAARTGSPRTQSSDPPTQIGGYRIISELGRGGLGVVYLANQVALQRNVALKVIRGGLNHHAAAIARFVREAYAAAQLTHHNVVQIYDLGQDRDINYFSMELVDGKNLAELVQETGKLPPRVAAGYILQAARGLEYAHNCGMVHRDIKPANLMLNKAGVVKVADLGLVKWDQAAEGEPVEDANAPRPKSRDLTVVGSTLGTINYMSPEQAIDSTSVDHRADIYSLGCTFYAILTGTPPYKGKSVAEVISKHQIAPPPRIDIRSENLPGDINAIIGKMMAKNPADRYQNLGEAIADLERFLGLESGQKYHPSQQEVAALEQAVQQFNTVPGMSLRTWGPWVFAGAMFLAVIVALFLAPAWIIPILIFSTAATASGVVLTSLRNREYWFGLWREWVWARRWETLGRLALIVLMVLAVAWVFGVGAISLVMLLLGVAAGFAWDAVVYRGLRDQRQPALEQGERLLQKIRMAGISEPAIQVFVAQYAGNQWEEFFEALFGYEAKRRLRADLAREEANARRQVWRPWVDWLVNYLEKRVQAERQRRDQKNLVRIEQAALVQQGVKPDEARAQASAIAAAIVEDAAKSKPSPFATATSQRQPLDAAAAARLKREKFQRMMAEARSGKYKRKTSLWETLDPWLSPVLGAPIRLALGAILLIAFGFWVKGNLDVSQFAGVTAEDVKETAGSILSDGGETAKQLANRYGISRLWTDPQPLNWPVVGSTLSGFAPAVAGLVLVLTGLLGGWRMSLVAIPAAVLLLFPSALGIPNISWLGGQLGISSLIAVGLIFMGLLFHES